MIWAQFRLWTMSGRTKLERNICTWYTAVMKHLWLTNYVIDVSVLWMYVRMNGPQCIQISLVYFSCANVLAFHNIMSLMPNTQSYHAFLHDCRHKRFHRGLHIYLTISGTPTNHCIASCVGIPRIFIMLLLGSPVRVRLSALKYLRLKQYLGDNASEIKQSDLFDGLMVSNKYLWMES